MLAFCASMCANFQLADCIRYICARGDFSICTDVLNKVKVVPERSSTSVVSIIYYREGWCQPYMHVHAHKY